MNTPQERHANRMIHANALCMALRQTLPMRFALVDVIPAPEGQESPTVMIYDSKWKEHIEMSWSDNVATVLDTLFRYCEKGPRPVTLEEAASVEEARRAAADPR